MVDSGAQKPAPVPLPVVPDSAAGLLEDETCGVSRSLPHASSSPLLTRSESMATTSEELTIENSLIGSRVPLIPRSISGGFDNTLPCGRRRGGGRGVADCLAR